MKKKIIIAIISTFSAGVVLIAACIGWFVYNNEYKLTLAGTENSPDGNYAVVFQMVGSPDWPFGSTAVRITVKEIKNNEKLRVIDTSIHNDGGVLSEYNWDVLWQDESVKIILKGSEQKDAVHIVMLY